MDLQVNLHDIFANDRDDEDDQRLQENQDNPVNAPIAVDAVQIMAQFRRLCIHQLNTLYATVYFNNTIDRSEFGVEFRQRENVMFQLVDSIIISMNGDDRSSENAHRNVENVRD